MEQQQEVLEDPLQRKEDESDEVNVGEIRSQKERGYRGADMVATVARLTGTEPQDAEEYQAPFMIANRDYELVGVKEFHDSAAGSDGDVEVNKNEDGGTTQTGTTIVTIDTTKSKNTVHDYKDSLSNTIIPEGTTLGLQPKDFNSPPSGLEGMSVMFLLRAL